MAGTLDYEQEYWLFIYLFICITEILSRSSDAWQAEPLFCEMSKTAFFQFCVV
jgi:hypothetical protein